MIPALGKTGCQMRGGSSSFEPESRLSTLHLGTLEMRNRGDEHLIRGEAPVLIAKK
jgi:hypothetical protein